MFKQKTAYEVRISDWSSDVCSSDLLAVRAAVDHRDQRIFAAGRGIVADRHGKECLDVAIVIGLEGERLDLGDLLAAEQIGVEAGQRAGRRARAKGVDRSEEHTSELQSLMRN